MDSHPTPLDRAGTPRLTSFLPDVNEAHLAPTAIAPVEARDFVKQYLTQHHLDYLIDEVCLVVSELVTNAVVHARTPIRVRIEELPFCVRLTVYDEGVDLPVLRLATRLDSNNDDDGRSLWLVEACTEDWGTDLVADEGKCTWALFAVRPKSSWVNNGPAGV